MDEKFKNTNFDNAKPVSATPALALLNRKGGVPPQEGDELD
jgi:hypothetical protein